MSRADIRRAIASARPTLADRIVAYFDPVSGARRAHARMMTAAAGAYTGGSRSKRTLSAWKTSGGSADADILPDLTELRERSRDLVRNAPLAAGAIETVALNVIGTGMMPKFKPKREMLGWDEARATAWARDVEQKFSAWAESTDCDAARTQSFYGLQDLAFRSAFENGDVFSLLPVMRRPKAAPTLAIQLIEADRASNKDGAADSARLAGGVALDDHGAPMAYHFRIEHPGGLSGAKREWRVIDAYGTASGRRNVLHLYSKRRIGQTRGVPYLAPVIETIKQMDRLTEAEVFAAVSTAMFAIKVKTPDKTGLSPLESAMQGATPARSDAPVGSGWNGTLTPGLVVDLGPNEDIDSINPNRPNALYDPFFQAMAGLVGVGLGLPKEVLLKQFLSSYSAARSALLEAWKFYRSRREWIACGFCDPIKDEWLAIEVANGRIDAPGFFSNPLLRYAYGYATWHGDGPGSINPRDEASAIETRLRMHLTTLDQEIAEYNGGDAQQTIEQAGRELAMKETAGLMSAAPTEPAQPPAAEDENTDPGAEDAGDDDAKDAPQPRKRANEDALTALLDNNTALVQAIAGRPQPDVNVNFPGHLTLDGVEQLSAAMAKSADAITRSAESVSRSAEASVTLGRDMIDQARRAQAQTVVKTITAARQPDGTLKGEITERVDD